MSGKYVGRIKMRYIGKPNGVYMKGAWSGYDQGKIYDVPADYMQWKFWELVESPPEIRAPEPKKEDSVFKDEIFLPPNEMTSSVAPTPVLTSSLRVGEVTQSTQEKLLDAVEQAKNDPVGKSLEELFPGMEIRSASNSMGSVPHVHTGVGFPKIISENEATQSTPETTLDMIPFVIKEGIEDNKAYLVSSFTQPVEPSGMVIITNLEKVTTPVESVVTQVEVSSEVISVPKTGPITELITHEPDGDKTIPVLATMTVEMKTHDDKPAQGDEKVVMGEEQMPSLTEDDGEEDDDNEMPPELLAEMRSLGEELPGEQVIPKRRRPKKLGV